MQKRKNIGWKSKLHIVVPASLLGLLFTSYFVFPTFQESINEAFKVLTSDDEELIEAWVAQFGMLGPLVIILAMTLQMFMFVVPNILLMMIAIISYGPVWGSLISLTGVFTASSLGYFIGCKLSPITLERYVSATNQQKIAGFIRDYGLWSIMITRLCSFSNDALSFVAGILQMKYHRYILATLAGITPLILMLALFGRSGKIEKALIIIASASFAILIVYIYIDKKRKKRKVTV